VVLPGLQGYSGWTLPRFNASNYVKAIKINQPTRCNNFSSSLFDVYLQLNVFWVSSHPSSGATTAVAASGLPSELGDNSAVGRGRTGQPNNDQQHCYHHDTKVKPEAATAVVAPDDGCEDVRNTLSCK
jgi:hypothetical protein